jgi:hypothetical protein
MTTIDGFMYELETALHVRGRPRRRLLAECREHLADSGTAHGAEEAVRRFGAAADLARGFDLEVATRRVLWATVASVGGVLGIAVSALAMLNGVDAHASAPAGWAVVFFGAAQTSAAALFLAVLRAAAMRGESGTPADVLLLCRRCGTALGFAFLTLFALGAAVPGETAVWAVLAGPVLALIAVASTAHARSLARKLQPHPSSLVRAPLADVAALAGRSVEAPGSAWHAQPAAVLVPAVVLAMVGAFAWDLSDHGTVAGSGLAAGIEAALTIAGFVFLGGRLGLHAALAVSRPGRRRAA